jgi:SLT domain-containing protein
MTGYIQQRYGNPINAAAHERAFNWYDRGGWLMPGATLAVNSTGRPERVVPPGGDDDIKALLERIHWAIRGLTDVAAAIPARTGHHVGGAINGAAGAAGFRNRYSRGGA